MEAHGAQGLIIPAWFVPDGIPPLHYYLKLQTQKPHAPSTSNFALLFYTIILDAVSSYWPAFLLGHQQKEPSHSEKAITESSQNELSGYSLGYEG